MDLLEIVVWRDPEYPNIQTLTHSDIGDQKNRRVSADENYPLSSAITDDPGDATMVGLVWHCCHIV